MHEYREESRRLEQRERLTDSSALHKSFEYDAARILQVTLSIHIAKGIRISIRLQIDVAIIIFYSNRTCMEADFCSAFPGFNSQI